MMSHLRAPPGGPGRRTGTDFRCLNLKAARTNRFTLLQTFVNFSTDQKRAVVKITKHFIKSERSDSKLVSNQKELA